MCSTRLKRASSVPRCGIDSYWLWFSVGKEVFLLSFSRYRGSQLAYTASDGCSLLYPACGKRVRGSSTAWGRVTAISTYLQRQEHTPVTVENPSYSTLYVSKVGVSPVERLGRSISMTKAWNSTMILKVTAPPVTPCVHVSRDGYY